MIRVSPNRAEPVALACWRSIARVALLACTMLALPAFAHEGHDHGDAPVAQQQALATRLTHVSARLEVVALLQGADLLVYADDYASNAPVSGLRVDVRSAGRLVQALEIEPGLYRANLQIDTQAREVPLDLSLSGEGVSERFGGELPIDATAADTSATGSSSDSGAGAVLIAGAGIAALLLVIAGVWRLRKRRVG